MFFLDPIVLIEHQKLVEKKAKSSLIFITCQELLIFFGNGTIGCAWLSMRNRFMCRDMPFIVVIKQTLKLLKLLIVTDFASHRIQILLRLFGTRQISIEDRHKIRVLGSWLVF